MQRTISLAFMMLACKAAVAATACESFSVMAARGNAFAQTEFAYCLLRGIGRPADVGQAIEMLESAAESGLPKAKANLADLEAADDSLAIFDSSIEANPLVERTHYLKMLSTDVFTRRYLLEPEALVQAVGFAARGGEQPGESRAD
jgi:TPR repeat protein